MFLWPGFSRSLSVLPSLPASARLALLAMLPVTSLALLALSPAPLVKLEFYGEAL